MRPPRRTATLAQVYCMGLSALAAAAIKQTLGEH
jgi:hypothetical protein